MLTRDECVEKIMICYNKILEPGNISEEWKRSRTKMIPKMKKTYCERLKTNSFNKLFIQDFYGSDKGHIRKPLNSKR